MKYLSGFALLAMLAFAACTKGPARAELYVDSTYLRVRECSVGQQHDSLRLATAMQGQWKEIWYEFAGGRHTSDSNLRVTFTPEGRYAMLVNNRAMSAGIWNLAMSDASLFHMQMRDTLNAFGGIPGNILLCGTELIFLDSTATRRGIQYFARI